MRFISFLLITSVILVSCKKEEPETPTVELKNGMLVLCEGLFQQNNSSLSWVNFMNGSSMNSFFVNLADRALGDTGNDIQRYGDKIFIVVNVSSTIEVISAETGASIKQIPMFEGSVAKQPRNIVFSGNKAYVTCYDGFVDVINLSSLEVESRIPVGSNPEGLAVLNERLYVANSGGLNFPNVDSTLSVIDLNTNSELTRITVGKNPGSVMADDEGDIYVISRGDYGQIPSRMHKINTSTNIVAETFLFDASGITKMKHFFLINTGQGAISRFNANTEQLVEASFLDVSGVQTIYGVNYSETTDRIYVADAKDYTVTGDIFVYESSGGAFLNSYGVGLNPSKVVVYGP